MGQLQDDEKWYVRAQLALEELKSAKRSLAELEMAYEEEGNTWNTMVGGFALFGGAFLVFLIWQGFVPYVVRELEGPQLVFGVPIAIALVVGVSAWIGCAPAGFIGLWRAMRSSGWFVVGGGVLGIVLLLLFFVAPIAVGPVYMKRQRKLVRELKEGVCVAKKRLAAARAAIS